MNQDDEHFSPISRNNQGICMPVAAYCYAMIKHPRRWTEKTVDEILEIGDELYRESLEDMHEHEHGIILKGKDLARYCTVGEQLEISPLPLPLPLPVPLLLLILPLSVF